MSDAIAEAIAAASIRLGDAATGVLARLGGALGEATRAVASELAALPARAHTLRRAEILAASRAAVPVGVRVLDPSWLEAALAPLPARARTSVGSGGGGDATDVWLARWATAGLPPVSAMTQSGPLARQLVLPARDLVAWLATIGADQLAYALGGALAGSRAIAAARERIARPPRLGSLGPQRSALARCQGVSLDDELDAFTRIACRAVAPHLGNDPAMRLLLTRRFPYERGRLLERELALNAATPLDHAPSVAALLAP